MLGAERRLQVVLASQKLMSLAAATPTPHPSGLVGGGGGGLAVLPVGVGGKEHVAPKGGKAAERSLAPCDPTSRGWGTSGLLMGSAQAGRPRGWLSEWEHVPRGPLTSR